MDKNLENKFKELNTLLTKAKKLSEKFVKKEDTSFSNTSSDFIDKDIKIYEPKRKIFYNQYEETQFEDFKKSEE